MKTKTFDCVDMKRRIQEKILEETEGLSEHERAEKAEKEILDDPILGPVWRDKQRAQSPPRP